MKIIYPTNIKAPILVDDEDYEQLIAYNWQLTSNGYAARTVWSDGKCGKEYMHRRLAKPKKSQDVDHIDLNRINNQKANLRLASRSQNMANVNKFKKATARSKYKGVSYLNRPNLKNKWIAYIKKDYITYYLGYFNTEEEAAYIYDQYAMQLFGQYSHYNVLDSDKPVW